ncbi:MAG TPA: macro domain-containing protein [Kofleriaceae bacterium]|nr:macro domain-containing protein [Kofleriaceae bacterium]
MTIRYLVGDATALRGGASKLLVHVCNDAGKWGKGFVVAISRRWKDPEQSFQAWFRGKTSQRFALGEVQLVQVEPSLWVANLVGQHGVASKKRSEPPIRYDAIRIGLANVREHAMRLDASVHMPRIGCGLAGGRWDEIEPILASELAGIDVTVYDVA